VVLEYVFESLQQSNLGNDPLRREDFELRAPLKHYGPNVPLLTNSVVSQRSVSSESQMIIRAPGRFRRVRGAEERKLRDFGIQRRPLSV
jgi:hypothetical protein